MTRNRRNNGTSSGMNSKDLKDGRQQVTNDGHDDQFRVNRDSIVDDTSESTN